MVMKNIVHLISVQLPEYSKKLAVHRHVWQASLFGIVCYIVLYNTGGTNRIPQKFLKILKESLLY